MKKAVLLSLFGAFIAFSPAAHAQVTYDANKVTCADYAAMDPDTARAFSAWVSGWFNQQAGSTVLNVDGYRANVASVTGWCAKNPDKLIMNALKVSAENAKPGMGGPTSIDGSLITCGEFLKSDADTQELVGSWMGGWFMSTKNLTVIDPRYVKRNAGVVGKACKKSPKTKLMTVLQKNWK